jgi:uncharacterized protein (DUF736 family)
MSYPYTIEDVKGVNHLSSKQKQDIADDWNKNHEEAEAEKYIELRLSSPDGYRSIGQQLDEIFHEGIDAWKTRIQAVKNKYPKPE